MNTLVAPDSFKDTLAAPLVCEHLRRGLLRSFPAAQCRRRLLTDGSEGTLGAVLGGKLVPADLHDPLFHPLRTAYPWLPKTATAVVGMNRASGLERLVRHERAATRTTTLGTGELLAHALDRGARHLVLTVGGSASTDGGLGMATTLGYGFFDERRAAVPPTGEHLARVHRIDTTRVHPRLAAASCRIATDVTNPFYGPTGAAQVFAAQKGADAPAIARLDVSLLITGEGRVDAQTWQGKLLGRLLARAAHHRVPAVLVCGTLLNADAILADPNVCYATSILTEPLTLAEALRRTPALLETQGQLLGRLLAHGGLGRQPPTQGPNL